MVRGEDREVLVGVKRSLDPLTLANVSFSFTRQARLSQAPIRLNPVVMRRREATKRSIQLFYQTSTGGLLEILEVVFNPEACIDLRCRNVRHSHDVVPCNDYVLYSVNGRNDDQSHVPFAHG